MTDTNKACTVRGDILASQGAVYFHFRSSDAANVCMVADRDAVNTTPKVYSNTLQDYIKEFNDFPLSFQICP